ncbi:universal stress protein [Alicyclobacillus fastidiosus]|uniref:Universal stress protein n=1 Tax=Alicyclobacillus fastidiosus TaxID=392011 RepID=A0ABY6ZHY0_9BACL|nr:universal stress protein [Alicyclobacillus fastidiosus]WAH42510.1 universal stress protein [Alicyclobacillus fastidiosus]GMA64350.1 universal stress protein UspA [Alicyclobacillus fastidiosus]
MYKRILVPIDDSDTVDSILHEVAQIWMENRNRTITLFHVLRPVNSLGVGTGYIVDTAHVQTRLEKDGHQLLEQAGERLSYFGIEPKMVLEWGEPAREISRYAESEDIDLIVVGNKDKGLLDKLLSGSVSQRVVEKAPADVLVVK